MKPLTYLELEGPRVDAARARTHTNGYDPMLVAINGVLQDRECDLRITDITDELWEQFIGPMIDAIQDEEIKLPNKKGNQ